MNIITLTTDFGTRDYSVAALKGRLLSCIPKANVIDISHEITPFDIFEACYTFGKAFVHFPKNSIHIVGVDSELSAEKQLLLVKYDEHFIICPDNGFISLLLDISLPKEIYRIEIQALSVFPLLDFVPEIVQKIVQGTPLNEIGTLTAKVLIRNGFNPIIDTNDIVGSIIYIDHYGNVVSNITKEIIEKFANGRRFSVFFRYVNFENISIEDIDFQYNSIENRTQDYTAQRMLIFNHSNHLELAIYRSDPKITGGASSLFNLKRGDKIRIIFH